MTKRSMLCLVLVAAACSMVLIDGVVFRHTASAASPVDQQILSAVTALQGSVNALQTGAISDLQTQITALQNALNTLQNRVGALHDELVGPGRSNVRISPEVVVAPDENAGCSVANVSSDTLQIHTELRSFDGSVIDESTDSVPPGAYRSPVGINQPGGDFQIPVHCKFTVLTSGHSRSDIRGQVVHVQGAIVEPAE
jgi:hypothetical protein